MLLVARNEKSSVASQILPPRSERLDEWGRRKGGSLVGLGVALKRAFVYESPCLERERKCCRYLGPFFLNSSIPAFRNASQICATLRPSRAAMASRAFLSSDSIRNVSLVSFVISREILAPLRRIFAS
jgi:hypothetical protein